MEERTDPEFLSGVELENFAALFKPPPNDKMSKDEKKAVQYLKDQSIYRIFNFMMRHLLARRPDDPIEFLVSLLDGVMIARTKLASPPAPFASEHVKSIFTAFDPGNTGFITIQQFNQAMTTLGFKLIAGSPPVNKDSLVARKDFERIVDHCSDELYTFANKKDQPASKKHIKENVAGNLIYPVTEDVLKNNINALINKAREKDAILRKKHYNLIKDEAWTERLLPQSLEQIMPAGIEEGRDPSRPLSKPTEEDRKEFLDLLAIHDTQKWLPSSKESGIELLRKYSKKDTPLPLRSQLEKSSCKKKQQGK